jgi:hypothetical protein
MRCSWCSFVSWFGESLFRRFLQGYSKMVVPITNFTRKDKRWEWTKECQEAFEMVKHALTNAPVLAPSSIVLSFVLCSKATGFLQTMPLFLRSLRAFADVEAWSCFTSSRFCFWLFCKSSLCLLFCQGPLPPPPAPPHSAVYSDLTRTFPYKSFSSESYGCPPPFLSHSQTAKQKKGHDPILSKYNARSTKLLDSDMVDGQIVQLVLTAF